MEPRNNTQEQQIDLMELLFVLRRKIVLIIICALAVGAMSFTYTMVYITPMYQASIRMIVNSKRDAYTDLTIRDVTSAEGLVATYATIIKSNRVMDQVIETLHLDMSWNQLNNMVAVNPVDNTPVMNIVVTGPDANLARRIVTTIAEVAPEIIVDAVEAGSCKVVSDPYCSGTPVSPNVKQNTAIGVVAGAVLCAGYSIMMHLMNDSIQSEDQLEGFANVPVLSAIPLVEGSGRYRRHRRRSRKK